MLGPHSSRSIACGTLNNILQNLWNKLPPQSAFYLSDISDPPQMCPHGFLFSSLLSALHLWQMTAASHGYFEGAEGRPRPPTMRLPRLMGMVPHDRMALSTRLPDGDSQIFRLFVFGPSLQNLIPPFPWIAMWERNPRKGSNFAVWQPCLSIGCTAASSARLS